ncbi:nuclease-related domain-containing protein [Streptomyces sp. NPDC005533]|uniref:nuclease-related domain-containing protein n=1 Tax=Streptomyces sp. NPDC005533 TaxID=3364723 RepID=UPI003690E579
MDGLRVTAWKRYGHDRLYVNLPDGTAVAWADRATGRITFLRTGYGDAVLDALARRSAYVPSDAPDAPDAAADADAFPGPTLPPLTPEHDLASHRPGEQLRKRLGETGPGLLGRAVARLLRRGTDGDSWRTGLAGERRVGEELDRLTRQGWRVLHSVPLPRQVDIDHLLIGPGGVFTVNTKRHPQKTVWVGDDMVKVNGGKAQPYGIKSRSEAERARKVLEEHCDFAVPVEPVLVFVDVFTLDVVATQLTIRVYREREVAALAPLAGVFSTPQVDQIYAVARDRRTWLAA